MDQGSVVLLEEFHFAVKTLAQLIPGHWIEAGVLYFNSSSDRPNTVSGANVQGSAPRKDGLQ